MLNKFFNKLCHAFYRLIGLNGDHEKEVAKLKSEISFQSLITQNKLDYTNYMLKKTIAGDINKAVKGLKL